MALLVKLRGGEQALPRAVECLRPRETCRGEGGVGADPEYDPLQRAWRLSFAVLSLMDEVRMGEEEHGRGGRSLCRPFATCIRIPLSKVLGIGMGGLERRKRGHRHAVLSSVTDADVAGRREAGVAGDERVSLFNNERAW